MKRKGSMVSGIIFGIVFLALGALLLMLRGESTLVLVIAIADLLFGVLLMLTGVLSASSAAASDKNQNSGEYADFFNEQSEPQEFIPAAEPSAAEQTLPVEAENNSDFNDIFDEQDDEPDYETMPIDELKAEEARLRNEARTANDEAKKAVEQAKAAIAQAKAAEQELAAAEAEARDLTGAEQQVALRSVDRLGNEVMALTKEAAASKKHAKALREKAKKLAEQHSECIDAVISRSDDDDDDDF